ncbi:MAG: T9SS type A sorting domain-containing protein [Bacteroidales bacterium]|nr:T9SS type A sorting domain-containing protein [Bacteroidales bacterium]
MKNKLIILLLLFTCNIQTKAQKYEEPQWKIPLYFEDATGAKDTIWIGYDPNADDHFETIDPQFDEDWIWIDTTKFNAYIWHYPNCSPTYPIDTDSVRKTTIASWIFPYSELGFVKGEMPVTITWDEHKLNSPDLPDNFPDISPRPRARIDMTFDFGPGITDPDCLVIYDGPTVVLTSNTEGLGMYPCIKTENLIFNSTYEVEPGAAFFNFFIQIMPHDYSYVSINEIDEKVVEVFPNIFKDEFFISNKSAKDFHYKVFSISEKKILTGNIFSGQKNQNINMSIYPQGVYFIKFFNNTNNFTSKLLKTQ